MKGADQCPKCASRLTADVEQAITSFYARKIRVCGNCGTAWEPFAVDQLLDKDVASSCFLDPCDNCAFRPGSTEQSDPVKWRELMDSIKNNGGVFYCHKGLPIIPDSKDGFAYPRDGKGNYVIKKMRHCRGWLSVLGKMWDRRIEAGKAGE